MTKARYVYVENQDHTIQMLFQKNGWKIAKMPIHADLICFSGGADVSPQLYGKEDPLKLCTTNALRDKDCYDLFITAVQRNIPCVGICRGAQFLNVVNGGEMWMDVDGHRGNHEMIDELTGEVYEVTSTHHQMMKPADYAMVVAVARMSTFKHNGSSKINVETLHEDYQDDAEVVFYQGVYNYEGKPKDTHRMPGVTHKSLCFQGHPEYAGCPQQTTDYFLKLIDELLMETEQ